MRSALRWFQSEERHLEPGSTRGCDATKTGATGTGTATATATASASGAASGINSSCAGFSASSSPKGPPQQGGAATATATSTATAATTPAAKAPAAVVIDTTGAVGSVIQMTAAAAATASRPNSASSSNSHTIPTTHSKNTASGVVAPCGASTASTTTSTAATASSLSGTSTSGSASAASTTFTNTGTTSNTTSSSTSAFQTLATASGDFSAYFASLTHADSPTSFNSSSSLTQSPSPQPATPPDLFPRTSAGSRAIAGISSSKPISISSPQREFAAPSYGRHYNDHQHHRQDPYLCPEFELTDCDADEMTTGPGVDAAMSRARQDSFVSASPKPISMNQNRDNVNRNRRESLAGSLMGGMSWGGMSFGSFVRDDIMMQGTSPFTGGVHQSPSFHSSSYLPKLEANFMRDFTCCNKILPNLHDLLQHYEEAHTNPSPNATRNNNFNQFGQIGMQGSPKMPNSRNTPVPGQVPGQQAGQLGQQHRPSASGLQLGGPAGVGTSMLHMSTTINHNMSDDMDAVADMEMDDAMDTMDMNDSSKMHQTRQLFGQQQRPQLNMNTSSGITQGLRTSQPPTPAAASFGFQNNPTVSSVNTPTLTTQQQQMPQAHQTSGMSDMEEDLPGMPMGGGDAADMGDMNFGNGNGANDANFCINDPGKHLFSPNGTFPQANRSIQAQLAQLGLTSGQFADPAANKALMARIQSMMMPEEHKPFKCPVIGCEKAYKNQNGLKYHKAHGHQTQQLHENGDGTFSIVNPETSAPYPGTLGMEKEKPFNCETCGKRYKNLNGLKYHKAHSLPCNPEFKLQAMAAGLTIPNLPGIGEDQMMQ